MRAMKLFSWLSFLAGCLMVLPGGARSSGAPLSAVPTQARSLDRALHVIPVAPTYLTLTEADSPTPSGSMTIEAWVKPATTPGCESVYGDNFFDGVWLGLCSPANGVRFSRFGIIREYIVDGSIPITAGIWWHIAATYDDATTKSAVFVNGVQDGEAQEQPMPAGWMLPPGKTYIGRDAYGYQFEGLVDEVRVWNVARTAEQIRADMYLEFIAPRPGLIAEWPLQGDGNDAAGSHHGTIDFPYFSVDSPLPTQTAVPTAGSQLALDGNCDPDREYAGAPLVSMGTAQVYPITTGSDLWLCVRSISEGPAGASGYRIDVYLDPQQMHGKAPNPTQLRLSIWRDGTRASAAGDSAGFIPSAGLDALWDAVYQPAGADVTTGETVELRIGSRLVSGLNHSIGLALREEWELDGTPVGGTPAWPFYATGAQPGTWGDLSLPPAMLNFPFVTR